MSFFIFLLLTQSSMAGFAPDRASCFDRDPVRDAVKEFVDLGAGLGEVFATNANAGPGSHLTAVFGQDDRAPVTIALYPWRSIGKVITRKSANTIGTCTGTMISACHVLTNSHCLEFDNKGNMKPMEFYPNQMFMKADVVSATYVPYKEDDKSTHEVDYAILKLNHRVGDATGWMGVHADPVLDGALAFQNGKLNATGHSADVHGGQMTNSPRVTAISTQGNYLLHDGDMFKGASGGPLWYLDEKGHGMIVGIMARTQIVDDKTNKFFDKATKENASRGLLSSTFYETVKKVRQEGCQ